jgi:hypothetical protein
MFIVSTSTSRDQIREQFASIAYEEWGRNTQEILWSLHPELFDGSQAQIPSPAAKLLLNLIRTPYKLLDPDSQAVTRARRWADLALEAVERAAAPSTPPVILVRDSLHTVERWHVSKDRDGLQVHCGRPIPGAPLVIREGQSSDAHHNVCVICIEKMLAQ